MEGLGEFLRKGRNEAGLSLEELAQRTRIRVESLESLEREDLEALPTEIYVRGFVKLVCRELQLATEDGLVRYEALRFNSAPPDEIIWAEERETSEPGWLEEALKDPERVVSFVRSTMRWGAIGLGGVIIVVVGVMGTRWLGRGEEPRAEVVAATDAAAGHDDETASEPPKEDAAAPAPPPEPESKKPDPPAEKPPAEESRAAKSAPDIQLALVTPQIPERVVPGTVEPGEPVVETPPPEASAAEPVVVDRTPAPAASRPGTRPTERTFTAPRPAAGDRLVLIVEALRPVDIEVLLDGIGLPRHKLLVGGERKIWKADSLFLLSATDGGAIRLLLQGVDLGVAGTDGEPIVQARIGRGP
jgi:cytoskeletal protein RodZ